MHKCLVSEAPIRTSHWFGRWGFSGKLRTKQGRTFISWTSQDIPGNVLVNLSWNDLHWQQHQWWSCLLCLNIWRTAQWRKVHVYKAPGEWKFCPLRQHVTALQHSLHLDLAQSLHVACFIIALSSHAFLALTMLLITSNRPCSTFSFQRHCGFDNYTTLILYIFFLTKY